METLHKKKNSKKISKTVSKATVVHKNGHITKSPIVESPEGRVALQRTLGLFNGVALIVGIIVGSGIFISPRYVLDDCGSVGVTLIVWVFCGIVGLAGALSFAELGMRIPRAGGLYAYIEETFGDLVAFLYVWMSVVVVFPSGNAVIAKGCGSYLLRPFFPCGAPTFLIDIVAALVVLFLTYVNCRSMRVATFIQDIFTIVKTLAMIIVIITGMVVLGQGQSKLEVNNLFEHTTTDPGRMVLGIYGGLFAYSGWYTISFLTEELKHPQRDLPRAIGISLPLTTLIYTLTNVAYFVVIGREGMLQSEAVAFTIAEKLYGVMSWIMPILVACSCFGSLNGFFVSVSRLFFMGARNGHLPEFLALVSTHTLTPLPSVVLEGILTVLMLMAGDIDVLMTYAMFVEFLAFLLCTVTFYKERYRARKATAAPQSAFFTVPIWVTIFFTVVCTFVLVVPLVMTPKDVLMVLVFLVAGLPVYVICVKWKRKPDFYQRNMLKFCLASQKLICGVLPEDEVMKSM